jgi:hypothetical protein
MDLCGMAKQIGEYKIRGTVGGITFYKMEGEWYARRKSGLSRERVKRAKEFVRTMESARRLAVGSQLASRVYRSLPREEQVFGLFCRLKSAAMQALKEGKKGEEVKELLERIGGRKNKVERTKDEGEKSKGEERRGRQRGGVSSERADVRREKLRAGKASRCTLYAARKKGNKTKPWPGKGVQLFVDTDGGLKRRAPGAPCREAVANAP